MASLKQVRQRIKTSKNIMQITRAMKLVSAARLKKAQERALDARPYSEYMRDLMQSISFGVDVPRHPLIEKRKTPREQKKYGLILITAERGLAGSYNTNLIRTAGDFIKSKPGEAKLISIGKKGAQFFGKRDHEVLHRHTLATSGVTIDDAKEISEIAKAQYLSNEVEAVYVCYSKFYSAIRQVPEVFQLLPIIPPKNEDGTPPKVKEYLFEPDVEEMMNILLPKYLLTLTYQTLLEAFASEHGARMTAMTSATDNAKQMIDDLTLVANRERQARITTEILEVVGGAEALNG